MLRLSTAFRLAWLRGLKDVSGIPKTSINDWLVANQAKITMWSPTSFALHCASPDSIIAAFAHEANDVIRSSFESALYDSRLPNGLRSYSWPVIQSYYSAFFAVFGLLRLSGKCIKRIPTRVLASINASANRLGLTSTNASANRLGLTSTIPAEGMYLVEYDPSVQLVQARRVPGSGNQSHKALWTSFGSEVSVLQRYVNASALTTSEKNQLFAKLQELISNLNHGTTAGYWPSEMRISVNYRFEQGIWFPCKIKGERQHLLEQSLRSWQSDPMKIELVNHGDDDLLRFVSTCQCITSLCRESTWLMSGSCGSGKSFLQFGPLQVLRNAGIRESEVEL